MSNKKPLQVLNPCRGLTPKMASNALEVNHFPVSGKAEK
jgi:hypothetical protein